MFLCSTNARKPDLLAVVFTRQRDASAAFFVKAVAAKPADQSASIRWSRRHLSSPYSVVFSACCQRPEAPPPFRAAARPTTARPKIG